MFTKDKTYKTFSKLEKAEFAKHISSLRNQGITDKMIRQVFEKGDILLEKPSDILKIDIRKLVSGTADAKDVKAGSLFQVASGRGGQSANELAQEARSVAEAAKATKAAEAAKDA